MAFKLTRHTTETVWNNYEITIDEKFCDDMAADFVKWKCNILKPLTPELIRYYTNEGRNYDVWENYSEEEKDFCGFINDYINDTIWDGDMWTADSEIDDFRDEWEEL